MRVAHPDAAHVVYAWRLADGQTQRCSDDGEPRQTAGMPVLGVLTKGEVCAALCTVTRYYGGVKLGSGGLVRAYGQAATAALDAAGIAAVRLWRELSVTCRYPSYERLAKLVEDSGARIDGVEYGADVEMRVMVLDEEADVLELAIINATSGSAGIMRGKTFEMAGPV